MVRLIALYGEPEDRGAFDRHFREVHTPIVERYPGLRSLRVSRLEGVGGRPSAYYLMAEMAFDSRTDLDAAISSPAGAESARDLRNFASAGVALFVASDEADA